MPSQLYPGKGRPLLLGNATGRNAAPDTERIPDAANSEVFSLGDGCTDFTLLIESPDGPAVTDATLEIVDGFPIGINELYATLSIAGKQLLSYKHGGPFNGSLRVANSTGGPIKVWLQVQIL